MKIPLQALASNAQLETAGLSGFVDLKDPCGAFKTRGNRCIYGLTLLFRREISGREFVGALNIVRPCLKPQDGVKDQRKEEAQKTTREGGW